LRPTGADGSAGKRSACFDYSIKILPVNNIIVLHQLLFFQNPDFQILIEILIEILKLFEYNMLTYRVGCRPVREKAVSNL
jgi:hypothetical protein